MTGRSATSDRGEGRQTLDGSWTSAVRLVEVPTRAPGPEQRERYEEVFRFWHRMWQATFTEVAISKVLRSDTFLLHDEASALVLEGRVIGLMLHSFVDLRLGAHRELSLFEHYPAELLDGLVSKGMWQVMLTGQLVVDPDFRRRRAGRFVSDSLVAAAVNRFLDSASAVMLAFTRNDRSAHSLAYRFGATPLVEGHQAHGLASHIVAFYRDRVRRRELHLANESAVI